MALSRMCVGSTWLFFFAVTLRSSSSCGVVVLGLSGWLAMMVTAERNAYRLLHDEDVFCELSQFRLSRPRLSLGREFHADFEDTRRAAIDVRGVEAAADELHGQCLCGFLIGAGKELGV